jgi:hypothetical protein
LRGCGNRDAEAFTHCYRLAYELNIGGCAVPAKEFKAEVQVAAAFDS